MTKKIILRSLLILVGLLFVAWLTGFELFLLSIGGWQDPKNAEPTATTDAIVVLTGGSERVSTGLDLLAAGRGKKLFISGVHPRLKLDNLIGNQKVPKELRDCCVVLGHEAENTFGNAEETRTWMVLEGFHSLRLVTANYHMPRSLMVFEAKLPGYEILPWSVTPDNVLVQDWWRHPGTASLLFTEYHKYLAAALRLWLEP